VKYPSARALAFLGSQRPLPNRIMRRSNGGAIEPPIARMMSPGSWSLKNILLAVVRAIRRRTGYHRFWVPLPTQAPVTIV
jgi:hypothetical protein